MKKQFNLLNVITLVLLLLTLSSCTEVNTSNNPTILIIQGIPDGQMGFFSSGWWDNFSQEVTIYRTGTTLEQTRSFTGLVASGAFRRHSGESPRSVIAPLFLPSTSVNWTGSGTYDIILTDGRNRVRARNVRFTSGVMYVQWSQFQAATQ